MSTSPGMVTLIKDNTIMTGTIMTDTIMTGTMMTGTGTPPA